MDTGMTPMVWWSVIIIKAGSAPLNMRSRIPQVPDWRRLKLVRNPYILPLTASMFDWKFTINNLDSDGRDHIQFTNDAEKDIYIVYDLGDSKGMLKVIVSALKSEG